MATDQELLAQWTKRRDSRAFQEIAVRYAPMVYATCGRILRDRGAAEEVMQECFVALVQKAPSVRLQLGPWLHRVAVNTSLNQLRSNRRRQERESAFASERAAAFVPESDLYVHQ